MARAVPFITKMQSDADAIAYVMVLSKAMPPPVFEKAKGWLEGGIPAEQWAKLKLSVPALNG